MLKAHQACIDLEKGVLRIQGREVRFLAEHELPEKARVFDQGQEPASGSQPSGSSPPTSTGQHQGSSFPGQGSTLRTTPQPRTERPQPQPQQPRGQQASASRYPDSSIKVLMDLGATRELAIQYLDVAGGNVDVAASFLFN